MWTNDVDDWECFIIFSVASAFVMRWKEQDRGCPGDFLIPDHFLIPNHFFFDLKNSSIVYAVEWLVSRPQQLQIVPTSTNEPSTSLPLLPLKKIVENKSTEAGPELNSTSATSAESLRYGLYRQRILVKHNVVSLSLRILISPFHCGCLGLNSCKTWMAFGLLQLDVRNYDTKNH